jgi:hypothetical protein
MGGGEMLEMGDVNLNN